MAGVSGGFNNTIDLLARATGYRRADGEPMTLVDKCNTVMIYNDLCTPEQARAWYERAFELTL